MPGPTSGRRMRKSRFCFGRGSSFSLKSVVCVKPIKSGIVFAQCHIPGYHVPIPGRFRTPRGENGQNAFPRKFKSPVTTIMPTMPIMPALTLSRPRALPLAPVVCSALRRLRRACAAAYAHHPKAGTGDGCGALRRFMRWACARPRCSKSKYVYKRGVAFAITNVAT